MVTWVCFFMRMVYCNDHILPEDLESFRAGSCYF
ncbi:hypothetical protein ACPR111641_08985 [Acinetobacter pragensis]